MMESFIKINEKYLNDLLKSSKLDENLFTIIPTVIFLLCTFAVVFLQYHKYTCSFTKWKTRLYRDVLLHWTFLLISRFWFLTLKGARWLIMYLDFYINSFSAKEELYINKIMSHLCIFLILLSISMIPMLILTMKELYSRSIPNFLLWVGEDPWVRSEIGTSGHYLERPVRFAILGQTKNSAFRSGRSTSVDWVVSEPNYRKKIRLVKSLTTLPNSQNM